MSTLDIMLASLRIEEGLRLTPYRCTRGKMTIGYGHNMDAKRLPKDMAITLSRTGLITRGDAERLLAEDAGAALLAARKMSSNFDALTPQRQAVLGEMVFQLGEAGAMKFFGVRKAVEAGDFMVAAAGMLLSKWAKQTPLRVSRLAARMREG